MADAGMGVGTGRVRWVVGCVASLTALAAAPASAQESDAAARRALAEASSAFSAAYVAGDTATIRSLYEPDALLIPPGGNVAGADAIVRYFAPGPRRTNTYHAMVSERLDVEGDVALDVGTWHNRWRIDDGAEQTASAAYLVVWARGTDGRWRIRYDAWHRPG